MVANFTYLDRNTWNNKTVLKQIIIITTTLWEFFILALTDGLSLKFEQQQDSSSLLESSQYSGRSQ